MSAPRQIVIEALEAIAPPELAEPWDNVGLLVEPSKRRRVKRLLLTIDLTEAVLEEAIGGKCQFLVAYHPPIFEPLKALTQRDARQRIIVRALEAGIAVYCPHTALDAAPGGVNDWLCDGLGEGQREPLVFADDRTPISERCKLIVFTPPDHADPLRAALAAAGAGAIGDDTPRSFASEDIGAFRGGDTANPSSPEAERRKRLKRTSELRLEMVFPQRRLPEITRAILEHHPYEQPVWDVYPLRAPVRLDAGSGRRLTLEKAATLAELVERIKVHLGLSHVRVAAAAKHRRGSARLREIAVCPGAGGSLLRGREADLYLTGEMRHHDILAAHAAGASVVLTDHTHTERGYLPVLRKELQRRLPERVEIEISRKDAEPLRIV